MHHHPRKIFKNRRKLKPDFLTCFILAIVTLISFAAGAFAGSGHPPALEAGWQNPPNDARLRAYWWWLNGNVTSNSITRDLEQMKAKGFGGAVIIDAGGADQWGNAQVPHGPTFFTTEWRALYKHALREANRLGLKIDLNIQSGWNLGGPMVSADDAAKKLTWSELQITGPTNFDAALPVPQSRENYYRDTFAVAYRVKENSPSHRPLENWREKALLKTLEPFSTPDTAPLFQEFPATPGEEDTRAADVIDLTSKLGADGKLNWDAPAGTWQIFRFGSTIGDHAYVSTASEGWQRAPGATHDSYALDVYDAGAFQRYWNAVVEPLIADAGPLAGKTLQYLHTDSWEVENVNWTPTLREEFQKRCGYDLVPWLPVIAGKIVNSREESNRFLFDYRKTLGELTIDNHYKLFRDNAHAHGLLIHPESGGPHAVPIDAQRDLGWDDAPMSEFWAWSWEHRIGDENRFFVKQPASAAHTYGHKYVFAEGFTTIGPQLAGKNLEQFKTVVRQGAVRRHEPPCLARICLLARLDRNSRTTIFRRHALESQGDVVGNVRAIFQLHQPLPVFVATRFVRRRRLLLLRRPRPEFRATQKIRSGKNSARLRLRCHHRRSFD